jgi:hypothetical protein
MLQVFYAKWHNGLLEGKSSKGYDVIVELRRSSFVPCRSKERLEIEMLKESLRQWDDFYAHAFAQQQIVLQVS